MTFYFLIKKHLFIKKEFILNRESGVPLIHDINFMDPARQVSSFFLMKYCQDSIVDDILKIIKSFTQAYT